jgi:hypothetical protein
MLNPPLGSGVYMTSQGGKAKSVTLVTLPASLYPSASVM